jgi:hypothetical protein
MRRIVMLCAVLALTLMGGLYALAAKDEFSHKQHAGLFPLCAGCHEGVPQGNRVSAFPSPTVCAGCHDGNERRKVDWTGPSERVSNVAFSHPAHDSKQALECSTCHVPGGRGGMAGVQRSVVSQCLDCHAHAAREHFADARCSQCHVPLSRTAFTSARVEGLPEPPSHKQPGFLERLHGDLAESGRQQCEVCHTRERCAACHVDAGQRAEVRAFATAGPNLQLPAMKARYFLPESHKTPDFIEKHGATAETNIQSCATCHTRESCATCHASNAPRAMRALPARASVSAPGVVTTWSARSAPPTHRTPYFRQEHGTLASSSGQTCMGCHTRPQCEDCHSRLGAGIAKAPVASPSASVLVKSSVVQDTVRKRAGIRRRADYHPANFMERHGSPAYNRNLECSNCHETTRFCRDCHERTGMGTTGRLEAGFHDAQPTWLLNHGQAARQGLESCASCHKQTDCMQCHSSLGSFRVSPHGPGFDARRVQQRNGRLCFACHLSDPLQGRT